MKALRDSTLAVIGLGLMGGSLVRALQAGPRAVARVIGVDRDPATCNAARAEGAIARGETEPGAWLREADIVVLATPVRTILAQLERVGQEVRPGTLVLDLGSTKREIVRAMERLPGSVLAVGGHPMCGKETSGWPAADPDLYRDKLFLLIPTRRSSEDALETAAALARAAGARPQQMKADRHDRIVGATSHLPYLVAANLVNTVDDWAGDEPQLWDVAASGFGDTTRVAAGNVDMMMDILLTNRTVVAERLRACARKESELADLLAAGDENALRARLERAAQKRREWKGAPRND